MQASIVPVRADLSDNPRFDALVGKVGEAASSARQHAGLSMERMLEAAGGKSYDASSKTNPLYQAVFLLRRGGSSLMEELQEELQRFRLAPDNVHCCMLGPSQAL